MAKAKTTAKRSAKSSPKTLGRQRNARSNETLSSDPTATNNMRKRTRKAPKEPAQEPVFAGTGRVIAECDKVDAALDKVAEALIQLTRTGQHRDMPPLTITEFATADGQAGERSGWAVVSSDPQIPLTEQQARDIVEAMRSLGASAPIGIAAE